MSNFQAGQRVRILNHEYLAYKYSRVDNPPQFARVVNPEPRFYGRAYMIEIAMPDGYRQLINMRNIEVTE